MSKPLNEKIRRIIMKFEGKNLSEIKDEIRFLFVHCWEDFFAVGNFYKAKSIDELAQKIMEEKAQKTIG